jgi:capsular exopolysaccharide synthesis family protein
MPELAPFTSCADEDTAAALHEPEGSEAREPFRTLWRRLLGPRNGAVTAGQTLGVTSCLRGEGVSTVAAGLAAAAAVDGQSLVLVDANLERPALHRVFHLDSSPGLADALRGDARLEELVQASTLTNLSILTAGTIQSSGAWCCESSMLTALVQALKRAFPLVLFDLPALETGSITTACAGLLDGLLLVVEAQRAPWKVVQREKELLTRAGVPLIGAVLNKRPDYVPGWLRAVVGSS